MSKDMLTVPRDLLQDLIDDVADYAVSRTFKDRETTWRSDLLKRADELLARQPAAIDKPIGYVSAGDIAELAKGNGAIVSARARDTDVPLYAVPPAQHKSGWHPDFVIALYDNAAPHKRYTMDQMREYADAFHRSRIDAARAASTSANVAQGSEAELEFIPVDSMQHAIVYGSKEAIAALKARMERDYRIASLVPAPPAQTAITEQMLEKLYWTAMDNSADILKYMEEAIALTAAQSASGEAK